MNAIYKKSEKGQAIVLLVLSFVVLLGFTALAIDGSMLYSDRRTAQNAADAAAMAGAGKAGQEIRLLGSLATKDNWNCALFNHGTAKWTNIAAEGVANAATNNYTIVAMKHTSPDDVNYADVICNSSPPYLDVQVVIEQETPTTFAHFVTSGQLMSRVEAVSRVYPPPPYGEGNCIISLTNYCTGTDKGTRIQGDSKTYLNNCGAWSNSCTLFNGCNGEFSADELTYLTTSDWDTIDDCATVWDVDQIIQTPKRLDIDIPRPKCEAAFGPEPAHAPKENNGGTINPGWYDTISVGASKNLTMNPGLYCITKGGFSFSGGTLTGDGVTIALVADKGFTTAGTSKVILKAPPVGCEVGQPAYAGCPYSVGGLLIWMPASNHADVKLTGTTTSVYRGTVFVQEGGGTINVEGTSELASPDFGTALIGDSVKVTGTNLVSISYFPGDIYHGPALLEVAQ